MADALMSVGLPAAVLRGSGKLLAANAAFERLLPATFQDRAQRLVFSDRNADILFDEALSVRGAAGEARAAPRSIPIPASGDALPLIVHLLPVRGAANDIFTSAATLLVVTPVDTSAVPTATVLQVLFDLTPAEARVARHIAEAKSIDEIATELGVSRETVRSQLKAVLAKTGAGRQQELVAMLSGKALSVGSSDV